MAVLPCRLLAGVVYNVQEFRMETLLGLLWEGPPYQAVGAAKGTNSSCGHRKIKVKFILY